MGLNSERIFEFKREIWPFEMYIIYNCLMCGFEYYRLKLQQSSDSIYSLIITVINYRPNYLNLKEQKLIQSF